MHIDDEYSIHISPGAPSFKQLRGFAISDWSVGWISVTVTSVKSIVRLDQVDATGSEILTANGTYTY